MVPLPHIHIQESLPDFHGILTFETAVCETPIWASFDLGREPSTDEHCDLCAMRDRLEQLASMAHKNKAIFMLQL